MKDKLTSTNDSTLVAPGLGYIDCKFCDDTNDEGISVHEEKFRHLKKGESAHVECWIDKCVQESIKKHLTK